MFISEVLIYYQAMDIEMLTDPRVCESFLVVVEALPTLLTLAQGLGQEELSVHMVPSFPYL